MMGASSLFERKTQRRYQNRVREQVASGHHEGLSEIELQTP